MEDVQIHVSKAVFNFSAYAPESAHVVIEGYVPDIAKLDKLHRRLKHDGLPVGISIVKIIDLATLPWWRRALHWFGRGFEWLAKLLQC